MRVKRTNRDKADFYSLTGPFFGSRLVERATHDRFYDDPGKQWYVLDQGAASVLNGVIRNFYAVDSLRAEALILAIEEDWPDVYGIVPKGYAEDFRLRGYTVQEYKKNFIEVSHETD